MLTKIHQLCSEEGNLNEVKSTIEAQDKALDVLGGSCSLLDGKREIMVGGNASRTVKM